MKLNIPVNNYIIEVEKVWPFTYYYWSQENALEFLYENKNNLKSSIDLIKNNDEAFQKFMKSNNFFENF